MKLIVLCSILVSIIYLCGYKMTQKMKTYRVKKVEFNGKINKPLDDDLWEDAILLTDFSQPWRDEPMQETSFKALYTNKYLYLRYDVKESNLVISDNYQKKRDIVRSDRVEIFLRKDADLKKYYCLEVDPNGAVLDFSGTYYRTFDDDWKWPKGHLSTNGTIRNDGYRLDMTISLESLNDLGLIKNGIMEAGIFRADTDVLPDEENPDDDFKWITWVDPKTDEPDFHVPSSFGILQLSE
jgi:hypothetical protein